MPEESFKGETNCSAGSLKFRSRQEVCNIEKHDGLLHQGPEQAAQGKVWHPPTVLRIVQLLLLSNTCDAVQYCQISSACISVSWFLHCCQKASAFKLRTWMAAWL